MKRAIQILRAVVIVQLYLVAAAWNAIREHALHRRLGDAYEGPDA